MKINWKVRLLSKQFWIGAIPAALILIQLLMGIFGFELDVNELQEKLLLGLNSIFVILVLLGIISDPTTEGISDSELSLAKNECKAHSVDDLLSFLEEKKTD